MMQRKDLAKEFSLIVQQEITNHNNSLLATNISIEELKRKIQEVSENSEKKTNAIMAGMVAYDAAIEIIRDNLQKSLEKQQREIKDFSLNSSLSLKNMQKSLEERESYFLTLAGFEDFRSKILEWNAQLQRAFAIQRDTLLQEVKRSEEVTKASIESVRKSIYDRLEKAIEEHKEQERSLDRFALSFDGLKREIDVLKHRTFVIEKNIENLYTQIERLKGKIS